MFTKSVKLFSQKFCKLNNGSGRNKFNAFPFMNLINTSQNFNKSFYKINKRYVMMDFDSSKDYYKILGVDSKASDKDIKIAYHKLAKKHHPDLNQGKTTDMFKEMSAAYDILSDPSKRKLYDETRGVLNNPDNHHHDSYANEGTWGNQYSDRFYRASRSQNSQNSSSNFNKGSKTKTTYTFRDPKTGEYKTYQYEGDTKGNPFFKDFEDLLKQFNSSNWSESDKRKYGMGNQYRKEDPFSNFDKNFRDPYNHYRSNQANSGNQNYQNNQNPFQDQREKWNPNWQDHEYHSLMWARKFFFYFLVFSLFIWLLTNRRKQVIYINEAGMPIDYQNMQMPYQEIRRVPYPPQQETINPNINPAYNMPGGAGFRPDDPYVNPTHPAFRR
jgi:curved DNA-binding protein CbpA